MSRFRLRSGHSSPVAPRARMLALEQLEDRQLLAGNVSAYVSGGDLYIKGDNQANAIAITQVGPNTYRLIAGPDELSEPTTVNGEEEVQLTATGNLRVQLKGGNDTFQIYDVATIKDIFVDLGAGMDQFNAFFSGPGRSFPDNVTARNFHLTDDPVDEFSLFGVVRNFQVDNFFANLGPGIEDFVIQGLRARYSAVVNFGEGGSFFNVLPVENDTVGITARNLTLTAGGGDAISPGIPTVRDYFEDNWYLYDVAVDTFVATQGRSNDSITHSNLVARKSFFVDGGPGIDTWHPVTPPYRSPTVVNVEFQVQQEQVLHELQFVLPVGQSQQLATTSNQSFTTDYQVALDGRGRPVVTPVLSEVATGLVATAKVESISDDEQYIELSIDLTDTRIDDIWQTSVPLPGGKRTLQQPVVAKLSLNTSISAPEGGSVLLGGDKYSRNQEVLGFSNDDNTSLWEVLNVEKRPVLGITALERSVQATVTPTLIRGNQGEIVAVNMHLRVVSSEAKAIPRSGGSVQSRDVSAIDAGALKLTLFDGETKTVSRQLTQPLLTSYEITTPKPGKHLVDPVVELAETGTEFTATATVSLDRRYVQLDLDYLHTALTQLSAYKVFGPYGTAAIQLPTIEETQLKTSVFVPDGGTVLLGSIQDGKDQLLVMVTPRIIIQEEEEFVGESILAAADDLQVTLEVRTVRATAAEAATSVKLVAIEETTAELTHTIQERLVSDFAVATLAGGIRTVKPVLATFERVLEALQSPVIDSDLGSIDFQVQYQETLADRIRTGNKLTPFGLQKTRQAELTTLSADLAFSAFEGETVTGGSLVDSRGRQFVLFLTGQIIGQEEGEPQLPKQVILNIFRAR